MNRVRTSLMLILFVSLLAGALSVVRAPLAHADGSGTSVPISPYLIGQNAWYQPPDSVWPLVGQAGVTSVRIGGISYDQHMPDNNTLLHWIDQIRSIGAEPIIQVSRYPDTTGSQADLDQLASNAAALVQFVNITSARHVQFWSIGNEPDLPGHYPCGATTENDMLICVAKYVKAIAPAMRAVDPSMKIYAPDAAWYDPSKFGAWLGGSANTDITGADPNTGRSYIDGVTFHRYPFGGSCTRSAVLTEMHTGFPGTVQNLLNNLATANAEHGRTGANALTWGVTEFNISYSNPSPNDPTGCAVNSFLNGQFFAEYLGQGMKYHATFFNTWSINEGGGNGSAGDLGFLGGDPANHPMPRSSYYHLQMLSHLQGSFVPSSSNQVNVPAISAVNGTQENVLILNEDTSSHTYTVRLNSDPITSGSDTQINVLAALAQQYTDTIPGQTSVLLTFDAQGHLTQGMTYSLTDDLNNQPPHVPGWWT